jgi:hypothetical protein
MRKYFMIALILLTGLRGLAGDAMAIEMSRMHSDSKATTSAAALTESAPADATPCHGEGSKTAEDGDDQTASECTACQVCHSPALQTTVAMLCVTEPLAGYSGQTVTDWVSADLTHLQKPPVS